jgi:hypothetical protein
LKYYEVKDVSRRETKVFSVRKSQSPGQPSHADIFSLFSSTKDHPNTLLGGRVDRFSEQNIRRPARGRSSLSIPRTAFLAVLLSQHVWKTSSSPEERVAGRSFRSPPPPPPLHLLASLPTFHSFEEGISKSGRSLLPYLKQSFTVASLCRPSSPHLLVENTIFTYLQH